MTRAEHMRWCKKRAHQEYTFYLPQVSSGDARGKAITSMLADLGKHEETKGLVPDAFVMAVMTIADEASLFRWIDGFVE